MKLKLDLKNPRFRIPLLLLLITIAGGVLWYQQFYEPSRQIEVDLRNKIKTRQDTLRTIQALKPQRNILQEELILAQNKLDSLKSMFPDQKEIPKLIREITGVARASGITTTKFNPLPDIEREYFIENRYNIAVSGGYHELAQFYAFLANFTLIINLTSMNIAANPEFLTPHQEDSDLGGSPSVVASFEMTTFSSKK